MTALARAKDLLAGMVIRLGRLPWRSGIALGLVVGGGYLASLYGHTRTRVTIDINGVPVVHYTQRRSGEDILKELRLDLESWDVVDVPSDEALAAGASIRLNIATPVQVSREGRITTIHMHHGDLIGALTENGIELALWDELWTPQGRLDPQQGLSVQAPERGASLSAVINKIRSPQYVTIVRATRLTVIDDGTPGAFMTTADTVGEALQREGVAVYEGDRIVPGLEWPVVPGLTVEIQRAAPVSIDVDGKVRMLRTRATTVGELLAEAGLSLEGEDRVSPQESTAIYDGMRVTVVRIYDEYFIEEVPIPFETRWEANPELEIDQKRTANWGKEGAMRQQVRVHYENGVEVTRIEEEAWVAREPEDRIIEYGTGIVVRQLETPSGTLEYWRKIRMLATSYNAATAGTPVTSPTFGYTRLGEPARKGVIAVDPTVISMRQPMYVPGYGLGFAGDTGAAIKNRRVDLCFDDDNLEFWHRWVDVYLLTPVPPASQITWIIPNTPVERE